jgi:hypothetical protein
LVTVTAVTAAALPLSSTSASLASVTSLPEVFPTSGKLVTEAKLAEVLDKGKAAAVTAVTVTKDG